jgi:putative membrane protein
MVRNAKVVQMSSNTEVAATQERSIAKGLVAGLIGGIAGTIAMTFASRMFPPRTHGEHEATEVVAEKLAGHSLAPDDKHLAGEAIHWGFGAAVGAAYGALVEYYPTATSKEGASFGMALEALTQETALPALGLGAEPEDQTVRERASELTAHVVYGMATEMVRRLVRMSLTGTCPLPPYFLAKVFRKCGLAA